MNSIRKRILRLLLLAIIGSVFLGLLAVFVSSYIIIFAFGLIIYVNIALYSIRCPKCSTPVLKREVRLKNISFVIWGTLGIPRKCSHCGSPLP